MLWGGEPPRPFHFFMVGGQSARIAICKCEYFIFFHAASLLRLAFAAWFIKFFNSRVNCFCVVFCLHCNEKKQTSKRGLCFLLRYKIKGFLLPVFYYGSKVREVLFVIIHARKKWSTKKFLFTIKKVFFLTCLNKV